MNLERVEKIAEAVLYEGYMLYPYRASAVKNQQRWNFGVLGPEVSGDAATGADTSTMQTQCLVLGDASTRLDIRVRFLQIVTRKVARLRERAMALPHEREADLEFVGRLDVEGRTYLAWQESIEREVILPPASMAGSRVQEFAFEAGRDLVPIRTREGLIAGVEIRERESIEGRVEIDVEPRTGGVFQLTVGVHNRTALSLPVEPVRAQVLASSLVSVHTILGVDRGRFVSMIDPPQHLKPWTDACRNIRTWPVLVGDEGAEDAMLSSPIILYDYPQIASESPGSLFDGTEIDEILSLRILTMTEEEKIEMRQSDERARQILERTETMPDEQWMKLHGVLRGLSVRKEAP